MSRVRYARRHQPRPCHLPARLPARHRARRTTRRLAGLQPATQSREGSASLDARAAEKDSLRIGIALSTPTRVVGQFRLGQRLIGYRVAARHVPTGGSPPLAGVHHDLSGGHRRAGEFECACAAEIGYA